MKKKNLGGGNQDQDKKKESPVQLDNLIIRLGFSRDLPCGEAQGPFTWKEGERVNTKPIRSQKTYSSSLLQ